MGLKEDIERLARDRAFGFELIMKQWGRVPGGSRVMREGYKSTQVTVGPDLEIEFQEFHGGQTQVVSHRVPQEGVDYVAQGDTVFVHPSRKIRPSCEILRGPCVSDSRSIGTLHLGTGNRLVARAEREAAVLTP